MERNEIIPSMNTSVLYDGKKYTLTAYILRKSAAGELYHVAELLDANGNSYMYVPLEQVNAAQTVRNASNRRFTIKDMKLYFDS